MGRGNEQIFFGNADILQVFICVDPLSWLEYFETPFFRQATSETETSTARIHDTFTGFKPFTSRERADLLLDKFNADEETDFDEEDPPSFSTQDSLLRWLASVAGKNQTPYEGLVRIVLHDIDDLTMIIRASLDDIEEQSISLSPVQLQEHARYWRPLLGRYKLELRQLHKSISDLTKFLDSDTDLSGPTTEFKKSITLALNQLTVARNEVEDAHNALRAELQIAEARRSIQEAESVAKLTELAFLFIPLTFAASLFSMQVRELQSIPPASYFVATALAFVAFAYLIRLIARSSAIKQRKRRVFVLVRRHADLSDGEDPSTRQFVSWLVSHHIKDFIILLIGGLLTIPIVFLWRAKLNTGYSAMIKLILLPMDLALLCVVGQALLYGDWKSKLAPKKPRREGVESESRSSIASIA